MSEIHRQEESGLHRAELERLDKLASLLDSRYRIPGTGIRFGLDSLLGIIPGVGDVVTVAPSAYLLLRAYRLGASRGTIARMLGNTGVDFVVGAIPLVGDLFDLGFKANNRNMALLREDIQKRLPPDSAPGI